VVKKPHAGATNMQKKQSKRKLPVQQLTILGREQHFDHFTLLKSIR
jgi:hypothetical protein